MKKGLVSQETDQSFSITGRNPHEEPILATTLKPAPHERPSRQTLKFLATLTHVEPLEIKASSGYFFT